MIDLIQIIFFTFSLVMAVKIVTQDGMIGESLGNYAEDKLKEGNRIWEPLMLCQWCMPSIYSSLGFCFFIFFHGSINYRLFFLYPVVVGFSSLVCGATWSIIELVWAKKSYYEKAESYYQKAEEKTHLEVKTMKESYYKSKK